MLMSFFYVTSVKKTANVRSTNLVNANPAVRPSIYGLKDRMYSFEVLSQP